MRPLLMVPSPDRLWIEHVAHYTLVPVSKVDVDGFGAIPVNLSDEGLCLSVEYICLGDVWHGW